MATNTLVVYGMTLCRTRTSGRPATTCGGAGDRPDLDRGRHVAGHPRPLRVVPVLISALFVPVFAIMVVDYWIQRRGRYSWPTWPCAAGARTGTRRREPVAVGCFLVGAALAFYWTRVSPLPVGATLPTFAVTFVPLPRLGRATRSAGERHRAASPARAE
jgi:hypothetical protein